MKTIGFTTQFYTLWEVGKPYKVAVSEHQWYDKQDFLYIQNLSKSLDEAKKKLEGQNYVIDLDLRGLHSWTKSSELMNDYTDQQFSFGKLAGSDISACNDIWQLNRAMKSEQGQVRQDLAKDRLIEIGELIMVGGEFISKQEYDILVRNEEQSKGHGHYFVNGEKVELKVSVESSFGFDTSFGYTCVVIYKDSEGRKFKYMGSCPPVIEEVNFRIKGTVEHTSYKGQNETRLKRIKILATK